MRIFYLMLLPITFLFAHPHCFIDVYPSIREKQIEITWIMDEMSSQIMLMDFDRDHNGQLSSQESLSLFQETFVSLKKYNYYIRFLRQKTLLPTGKVSNFRASVSKGKVQYRFRLPLPAGTTTVRFCDEENYTAFIVNDAFVRKANAGKFYKVKPYNGEIGVGYAMELK